VLEPVGVLSHQIGLLVDIPEERDLSRIGRPCERREGRLRPEDGSSKAGREIDHLEVLGLARVDINRARHGCGDRDAHAVRRHSGVAATTKVADTLPLGADDIGLSRRQRSSRDDEAASIRQPPGELDRCLGAEEDPVGVSDHVELVLARVRDARPSRRPRERSRHVPRRRPPREDPAAEGRDGDRVPARQGEAPPVRRERRCRDIDRGAERALDDPSFARRNGPAVTAAVTAAVAATTAAMTPSAFMSRLQGGARRL
jgi:hypothetical protein